MSQIVICLEPNHPKAGFGDWESEYDDNVELSGSGYVDKIILSLPLISFGQAKEIRQMITDGFAYDPDYLPKNGVNLKQLANNKNQSLLNA